MKPRQRVLLAERERKRSTHRYAGKQAAAPQDRKGMMKMTGDPAELRARQEAVCARYGLPVVEPDDMVAVAMSTLGKAPVYGTRIVLSEGHNVSWFFHCGEYSDAADFYQPLHAAHLSTHLPLVLPYLMLPAGARFIIDDTGYEDIWMDLSDNAVPR
ncbi:immunity protein Imm33 domain-containing protein [Burkholderia lata]|nr:hypothetical protein [Burkholderia lata]